MLSAGSGGAFGYRDGQPELPTDFGARLERLKERTGLTWEAIAEELGVDCRQLFRWRRGTAPSGGALFALLRWAAQFPGGLEGVLGDGEIDPFESGDGS